MHQSKRLPLAAPPVIGYLHHSYPLSIMARDERYLPWFYCNYMQLRCYRNISESLYLDYYNFVWNEFEVYPWLEYNFIPLSIYKTMGKDFTQFMMEVIDLDYYPYVYVDEFYMPTHYDFGKRHFTHDKFISGYDREAEQFFAYGFNKNGNYQEDAIGFADFKLAFESAVPEHSWQNFIRLIKFNENGSFKLDVGLIADLLREYLDSKNTTDRLGSYRNPVEAVYGMETYSCLRDYFALLLKKELPYDIRAIHIMWEHKKVMLDRIRYLEAHDVLSPSDQLSAQFEPIANKAEGTRSLMLKYYMTRQEKEISKIVKNLEELEKAERPVLELLWEKLMESARIARFR